MHKDKLISQETSHTFFWSDKLFKASKWQQLFNGNHVFSMRTFLVTAEADIHSFDLLLHKMKSEASPKSLRLHLWNIYAVLRQFISLLF